MVQIQEQSDEDDDQQHQHQHQQASSSNNPQSPPPLSPSLSPLPRLAATPPPHSTQQANGSSPSSPSSISSDHTYHNFSPTKSPHIPSPSPSPPHSLVPVHVPVVSTSRFIRDQLHEVVTKTESDAETGFAGRGVEPGAGRGGVGSSGDGVMGRKATRGRSSVTRGPRREKMVKIAGLVLRFCEIVVCLVSFSVMAADKNRGWALDSFDRYVEFRYSITVNVIGFAYSGLQGLHLLVQLMAGKDLARSQLCYCFDFAMDQILAYLLLSSSSSAFTRVDDWISNWGKDKFPAMASASVGVSFLAFVAFALSSLISGYVLCTHRLT